MKMNSDIGLSGSLCAPLRVSDIIAYRVKVSPHLPALVEDGTWTFAQLAAAIAASRSWLVDRGVRPGDRVMIVGENCRALVALLFAALELDAWPVLANARLSGHEIDQIEEHSGARRMIFCVANSGRAMDHAGRREAVTEHVAEVGTLAILAMNETARPEPKEADVAKQVAALIYTSGTTGRPKGVMLTNSNLLFIASTTGMLRSLSPDDRVYGIVPITHILGLAVVLLGTLLYGGTLYLTPRFDPAAVLHAIEHDGISWIMGGPAMFALLVEYARRNGIETVTSPALRVVSAAGAPLDLAVKSAAERLLGTTLHNGYGITECSPTITQTRLDEPRNDCSVGPVLPGIEVELIGPDGVRVAGNGVGEVRVRGPSVMKGYYKAPEETAAAIDAEGWFNTRDLARFENGHLFIVGRTKELIIRYGFNVYPPEIEAVLNAHPAVTQSAVVGRVVNGEEEVVAFVQLVPDWQISATELADYAAERLAPYKRPSEIVLVAALPTTGSGKIRKNELARIAAMQGEGRSAEAILQDVKSS